MSTATARKKRSRRPARSRTILPPDPPRSAHAVDRLTLDGRTARQVLGKRLMAVPRSPSIEGPSRITLEVWDGDGAVLSAGVLGRRVMSRVVTVRLDGLTYVIASTSRAGDTLSLPCEHVNVNKLRSHGLGHPLRANRDDITRAHFCATMIRSAGVPVLVLDENVPQSTLKAAVKTAKNTPSSRTRSRPLSGDLTVKGQKATAEQRRVMAKVMAAALATKPSPKALLALVQAIITECEFRNVQGDGADAVSYGVIQAIPGTSAGINGTFTKAQALDIAYSVKSVMTVSNTGYKVNGHGGLIGVARGKPNWSAGRVAAAVINGAIGSGENIGSPDYIRKCDSHRAEALKIIAAAGGSTTATGSAPREKAYWFERKKTEDTWTACRRLLDEVQWRLFEREGVVIIAPDKALMRATPSLQLDATGPFLQDGFDFEMLRGAPVSSATCQILAGAYQVDPGEVARVINQSQLQDRWLISRATVDLMGSDPWIDTELVQPRDALPEPAADVEGGGASTATSSSSSSSDDKATRLKDAAKYFARVQPGYNENGHGQKCKDMDPKKGGDCSSSTSWCLWKAGFLPQDASVQVSDYFLSWGQPGQGKIFTVWVKRGSGQSGHVLIQGKDRSGVWRIDTGQGGGAKFYTTAAAYISGYVPRHADGY